MAHLAHDDVEEGQAFLDDDQGLRSLHAHARAEAAVELEHHRPLQYVPADVQVPVVQFCELRHRGDRQRLAAGNVARGAMHELIEIVPKIVDHDFR